MQTLGRKQKTMKGVSGGIIIVYQRYTSADERLSGALLVISRNRGQKILCHFRHTLGLLCTRSWAMQSKKHTLEQNKW